MGNKVVKQEEVIIAQSGNSGGATATLTAAEIGGLTTGSMFTGMVLLALGFWIKRWIQRRMQHTARKEMAKSVEELADLRKKVDELANKV